MNDNHAQTDRQVEKAMNRNSRKELERLRRICSTMPECEERLSHGEPTFFVRKRVFAVFSNNHHDDGHVSVLVPTRPGMQEIFINEAPQTYYYPAYVGCRGWIGIELEHIRDESLAVHVREAWDSTR